MNRYERPKGLTSYETVEQFIKAMNAGIFRTGSK